MVVRIEVALGSILQLSGHHIGGVRRRSADAVRCLELGDPGNWDFQSFTNIKADTKCWDDIKPSFHLYTNKGNSSLNGISIIRQDDFALGEDLASTHGEIEHLVVVIHGYNANAEAGGWPEQIAMLVLGYDNTAGLAVLTVDWKLGANPPGVAGFDYAQAAANTRYVGVATERLVRQLVQREGGAYLHCIGHSLGAHTCGFFGNAVEKDTGYSKASKVDRITALDPAGPCFTSDCWSHIELNGADPLENPTPRDERIDQSDARLVDAIHTDSDHLGIVPSVGHADFYLGKKLSKLGTDHAGCRTPVCDHGRSYEVMMASIVERDRCWAHFKCSGETEERGCTSTTDTEALAPRPHFGYWWDGAAKGDYGVVLEKEEYPFCHTPLTLELRGISYLEHTLTRAYTRVTSTIYNNHVWWGGNKF
jgi:pancreatic triacylglycerol lipase